MSTYLQNPAGLDAPSNAEVRISCAIMAHPKRAAEARSLELALEELGAAVVFDPRPSDRPSTLRTALAAWRASRPDATHHLVLQDDVALCDDFINVLCSSVKGSPEVPICLFSDWGSATASMVRWAALGGYGLAPNVDPWVSTVGLILPVDMANAFVEFVGASCQEDYPDDETMARFLESIGRQAFVSVPNLVEHVGDESLIGNGAAHGVRRSSCYRGSGDVMLPSRSLAPPPIVPYMRKSRCRAVAIIDEEFFHGSAPSPVARDFLQHAGLAHSVIVQRLDQKLDSPAGRRMEWELGYGCLHEVWSTSVALGYFAPLEPAVMHRPSSIAIRALSTLAPGGLRTVAPQILTNQEDLDLLANFVLDGFRDGFELRI